MSVKLESENVAVRPDLLPQGRKGRTTLGSRSDLLEVVDNKLSSGGLDDTVSSRLGVVRLSRSEGNSLGHCCCKEPSKTDGISALGLFGPKSRREKSEGWGKGVEKWSKGCWVEFGLKSVGWCRRAAGSRMSETEQDSRRRRKEGVWRLFLGQVVRSSPVQTIPKPCPVLTLPFVPVPASLPLLYLW